MGCGGVNKARVISPSFELAIEISGLSAVDNLFLNVFTTLKKLKTAASSLEETISNFRSNCDAAYLKDPTPGDAANVRIFAIAAALKSDVNILSLRALGERPHFNSNSDVSFDCSQLSNMWNIVLENLAQTQTLSAGLVSDCRAVSQQCQNFDFNPAFADTNLSVAEASSVVRVFQRNKDKLKLALEYGEKIEVRCGKIRELVKKTETV